MNRVAVTDTITVYIREAHNMEQSPAQMIMVYIMLAIVLVTTIILCAMIIHGTIDDAQLRRQQKRWRNEK